MSMAGYNDYVKNKARQAKRSEDSFKFLGSLFLLVVLIFGWFFLLCIEIVFFPIKLLFKMIVRLLFGRKR